MKKLLKIFMITLMFIFFYNDAFTFQNTNNDLKQIDFLGNKIDECRYTFLKDQENNTYDNGIMIHYKKFMANNENVRNCYSNIAKLIFKEFYTNNYDEMIEQYEDFIKNAYQRYLTMYSYNKYCRKSCGLLPEMKANQSTTYATQNYLIDILDNLEKFSASNSH